MKTNVLYYGDNLSILRHRDYFPDECVDLIYLDPPFNSKADYNILFRETSGEQSQAQIHAFSDFWHWDQAAAETFHYLVTQGPPNVGKMIAALCDFIGHNDMTAYLVMMAARLVELRRVLKPSGSIYLHCDPTASHYLKVVLDTIFGPKNFRNEIAWGRTSSHNDPKRYGSIHDALLFYSKTETKTFNRIYTQYSPEQKARYKYSDERGGYRAENLTAPHFSPTRTTEWRGVSPGSDRQWRFSIDELERLYAEGRILLRRDGKPRKDGLKVYLDEARGKPLQDMWTDIPRVPNTAKERLGYQTQKPLALLERIIQASSNEGDVVLDPFCGCGTAVVAAQKLNRKWVGIDVTHLAIAVMRKRLQDSFPSIQFEVIGEPEDLESARALAAQGPGDSGRWQFQWWALSLIGAMPAGDDRKKGADKGIDGIIGFMEQGGKPQRAIVQVKSGHVQSSHIRDLKGVLEREKAALGIYITLEPPTRDMRTEVASAGYYHSELWQRDYSRLQILTVEELLAGTRPDVPSQLSPYAQAQRIRKQEGQQIPLGGNRE